MSSFIVGEPLQRMVIDINGPLHETKAGNTCIAVVMDYSPSGWHFCLCLNVAKHLVNKVFAVVGLPKCLHSDEVTDICSKLFVKFVNCLGLTTTPSIGTLIHTKTT
jgi:hypothetical protein